MSATAAAQFARLLKPFPVKRLERALWHVQAEASALHSELQAVLIDPPATPEEWRWHLDKIDTLLWGLVERCWEAKPQVELLARDADRSFEVTVRAAQALLADAAPRPSDAA